MAIEAANRKGAGGHGMEEEWEPFTIYQIAFISSFIHSFAKVYIISFTSMLIC